MNVFEVSSHTVAPAERLNFFRDEVVSRRMQMEIDALGDAPFSGYTRGLRLGQIGVGILSTSPIALTRTAQQAARSRPEAAYFDMMFNGTLTVGQDGRSSTISRYACVVSNANRPYVNLLEAADERPHMVTLAVPAHLLAPHYAEPSWQVEAHDLSTGMGRVLVDTLSTVLNEIDYLSPSERWTVGDVLIDLVRAATRDAARAVPRQSEKFEQVAALVQRHFADEALGSAEVARAVGLSERSLRRLLAERETTLGGMLRRIRAEEARRRLESAAFAHLSVTEVLLGCGFSDISTAGRVLKAMFELSPSDMRAEALARQPLP